MTDPRPADPTPATLPAYGHADRDFLVDPAVRDALWEVLDGDGGTLSPVAASSTVSDLAGPGQPLPPGWMAHRHEQRFVVRAPRERVWGWLADPATFTDTQVPPWRVEFLGGGFDEGVVTTHHGPGLHLPGVLHEIRDGEYRDLQYLYGAYAVSFRLLRPTRLEVTVADTSGGTEVTVSIDAHVHPRMLRPWALSQRLFWRRFETWTRRAITA